MAGARLSVALRPFLPADAAVLAAIFADSIAGLTGEDYSEAQQQAWMASVEDEESFAAGLTGQLTLVATIEGEPVGFASLKGPDHIEMLYVHPDAARIRVGSALCEALERLAAARGVARLTVDASDTAHDFFRGRGYVDQQRSTVTVGDEWLARTRMHKTLPPIEKGPLQ